MAKFNAEKAIEFLPSLITLGHKPMITFCQVFDLNQKEPQPMTLEDLDKLAYLDKKHFHVEIVTVAIDEG